MAWESRGEGWEAGPESGPRASEALSRGRRQAGSCCDGLTWGAPRRGGPRRGGASGGGPRRRPLWLRRLWRAR